MLYDIFCGARWISYPGVFVKHENRIEKSAIKWTNAIPAFYIRNEKPTCESWNALRARWTNARARARSLAHI